ncbi:hypothetical protein [Burkholderia pseudomallei]|uniref:hypothetical protein n=1 Tax=Burkholderia pseudomallei TaxID=28450 RepID=UPI0012AEB4A7|nr:hypothetical protein [Burkholderia pseudomallei]
MANTDHSVVIPIGIAGDTIVSGTTNCGVAITTVINTGDSPIVSGNSASIDNGTNATDDCTPASGGCGDGVPSRASHAVSAASRCAPTVATVGSVRSTATVGGTIAVATTGGNSASIATVMTAGVGVTFADGVAVAGDRR